MRATDKGKRMQVILWQLRGRLQLYFVKKGKPWQVLCWACDNLRNLNGILQTEIDTDRRSRAIFEKSRKIVLVMSLTLSKHKRMFLAWILK